MASRPPNGVLLAEIGDLQPGFALDAGCGHGSEAIWLAASGWQVTAVDLSATALGVGRSTAQAAGADVKAAPVIFGHVTVTMDLFGHLFSDAPWVAMERMLTFPERLVPLAIGPGPVPADPPELGL